jgi:hypothetical protein
VLNAKPRLSRWSRLLLVGRVLEGRAAAHVAAEMRISRATAHQVAGPLPPGGDLRSGRPVQSSASCSSTPPRCI